jgi:hypothetical protein
MKKLVYLFLILICFTSGNSYSKGRSPWNFSEDFENEKEGRLRTNKFTTNNKGTGRKPFKIRKDPDGNQYLEVTVKDGWNVDQKGREKETTERAEFQVKPKKALGKEIWISFKKRLPEDFTHIDDRVLFFQFKNTMHYDGPNGPLIGLRYYENGERLKIGGDTGGNDRKMSRQKEDKYRIESKYKNYEGNWVQRWEKFRSQYKDRDVDGTAKVTPLGEWSTYKIGIHNTKNDDGFVKVYKDGELMFDYNGVTYDWRGRYYQSHIRIGIYRDRVFGVSYPDQTIHFDDFIVVSDEKTLDQILAR